MTKTIKQQKYYVFPFGD